LIQLLHGDCRQVLRDLAEASIDSCVTDPPYELGFMGKGWDSTGVANDLSMWAEVLRVLKPGAYLLAFSGTRTYHRMACAIEDAGFEIRDQIGWAYGSGFPKSHNGPWGGTALKPAWEPICMARKPLIGTVEANWRERGTGALNIDGCRVGSESTTREKKGGRGQFPHEDDAWEPKAVTAGSDAGRWPANLIHDGSDEVLAAFPNAPGQMADASVAVNERKTQNVYGAMRRGRGDEASADSDNEGAVGFKMKPGARRLDSGSAARFFYCAKASKSDRGEGNTHPTVKPTDLMRYLCRLVTPAGGTVLDPFAGSGSTLKAAELEGFSAIGIELQAEYIEIARRRIAADAPLFAEVTA
jgi:site-specific DNA-methyltransferase (adenine-specific)